MKPKSTSTKVKSLREERKWRGVFEKFPGSGEWWIRYVDSDGRYRREKAGTKSAAIDLVTKRKNEALQGKKLPEKLRRRLVPFSELADDALEYSKANNAGHVSDGYRIAKLKDHFGERPASHIPIADFRSFFDGQNWEPGTYNRVRTVLFAIYRLGIENKKVENSPARPLKRRKVSDDRVRFLNQNLPSPSEIEYLKSHLTEEARLRAVIEHDCPEHLDELIIALNTGMRRSEQYLRIDWSCVDLPRKDLFIPKSKNGESRHISLNSDSRSAFERLRKLRAAGDANAPAHAGPIFVGRGGEPLLGPRHWFDAAVKKAGISDFTWHDLRHTFASRLIMADVDIRTVAELMGHKKIQMTMRYAHLAPEHKLVAVERLKPYIP